MLANTRPTYGNSRAPFQHRHSRNSERGTEYAWNELLVCKTNLSNLSKSSGNEDLRIGSTAPDVDACRQSIVDWRQNRVLGDLAA